MEFFKSKQFIIGAVLLVVLSLCVFGLFSVHNSNSKDDEVHYNIVFDSNGGSSVSSQSVLEGESVKEPVAPEMEGYTFLGWYFNDRKYNFGKEVYQDITLEARWEKNEGSTDDNTDNNDGAEKDDEQEESKPEEDKKDDEETKVEVTKVTLNKTSLSLNVGDSSSLTATVSPSNATNKTVTWTSSNSSVATVSNGTVKAVGAGSATITATAGGKSVSCTVTVSKKVEEKPEEKPEEPTVIEVTSVSLNNSSLSLKVGESSTLVATVNPSDATNKTVTWTSSNSSVATVSNGIVKAVGAGSATITATAGGKSISCTVTVSKNVTYSIKEEKIESSAIGQYYIYIVSSEGQYVSGTVNIVYTNGSSKTATVPASGLMVVKSAISSISVVNAG